MRSLRVGAEKPAQDAPRKDEVLVRRCQAGEKAAYEGLVTMYEARVASLIFHTVGSQDDVRDLVQETFVKAFLGLKKFGRRSAFSTWLYRIAVNVCIDHLRKRSRRPQLMSLPQGDEGPETREIRDERSESPRGAAARMELGEAIRDAVEKLPPGQRSAVVLHMVEGFSCEETANVLGCAVGTVKASLFKARERLRRDLESIAESRGGVR